MAEVVIVGCKLPNGLLLSVDGKTLRINGKARYNMPSPSRKNLNADVEYADGLTTVDKAFWDKWLSDHKEYAPVKSGAIYASGNRVEAVAKAKDTEEAVVGLEPIDPSKPIANVEPTDEIARALKSAKK